MLTPDSRLRINERHVTASVIDGEAIIINLESGLYFSLDRCGAAAWVLLAAGNSIAESAALLALACSTDEAVIQENLLELGAQLVERTLVAPIEAVAVTPAKIELSGFDLREWVAPTLNVYDDMGDVLALDPPLPQVEGTAD